MSVNKVILIGNVGADPELRYTGNGTAVCELRVATNEKWTDKSGKKQERTEWHRIVVWSNQGEACSKHLAKGSQVYIEGRIQTRPWEDKEGNRRYTTEIVASNVRFLGSPGKGRPSQPRDTAEEPQQFGGYGGYDDEGDVPF